MIRFITSFDVLFYLNHHFGEVDLKYKGSIVQIIVPTPEGDQILGEGPTFEDTATLVANKINRGEIMEY